MRNVRVSAEGRGVTDWVLDQVPESLWSVCNGEPAPVPADHRGVVEYTYLIRQPGGGPVETSFGCEYFTASDPEPCFSVGEQMLLNNVLVTVTDVDTVDEEDEDGKPVVRCFSVRVQEVQEGED